MTQRRRPTSAETERARQLRADASKPESLLWLALRNRSVAGLKFRRQFPMGSYVVDFICLESRLVVELDGESHEGRVEYDAQRTRYIESLGYRVFRVTNDEVLQDVESVALGIAKAAGVDLHAWLNPKLQQSQTPQS